MTTPMSEEAAIDENDLVEFKVNVKEYLALPDQISAAAAPVKELKDRKKDLEKGIIAFMNSRNITHCNCPDEYGGGVIAVTTSKTKAPVKKENWEKGIAELARKRHIELTFAEVEAEVNSTREPKIKHTLKRHKK